MLIKVYQNPAHLLYRGNHNTILLPGRPTAEVCVSDDTPPMAALSTAYTVTQHTEERPWWTLDGVRAAIRSTSVGDVVEVCGELYVVERQGFNPYRPTTNNADHLLHAISILEKAQDMDAEDVQAAIHAARAHLEIAVEESTAGWRQRQADAMDSLAARLARKPDTV